MKEAIIKYKSPKALKILSDLGAYLGFSVLPLPPSGQEERLNSINGVPVIPGKKDIDISELTTIFTGKNLDAATLRKTGWQRRK